MSESDILIQNAADLGLNVPSTTAANLVNAGYAGAYMDLQLIDSAAAVVFPPAVCIVLQTPTMWDDTPVLGRMLKNLVESHAKSITGIDIEYSIESQDTPGGQDGQNINVPTNTKRTQQNPSMTWPELKGNVVWALMEKWCRDMGDPDTNVAFSTSGTTKEFVSTSYGMTMLAIQFDNTYRADNILNAALFTNMYPQGTGAFGMERNIATSNIKERSITFNAFQQHNKNVIEVAKTIAAQLQYNKINSNSIAAVKTATNDSINNVGILAQLQASLSA